MRPLRPFGRVRCGFVFSGGMERRWKDESGADSSFHGVFGTFLSTPQKKSKKNAEIDDDDDDEEEDDDDDEDEDVAFVAVVAAVAFV